MDGAERDLKGVKGWLLLLCTLLVIFDPLVVLTSLFALSDGAMSYRSSDPQMFSLIVISGVLRIALAVFSLYAGLALWRTAPRAVPAARSYMIAVALVSLLFLVLPGYLGVSSESFSAKTEENIANAILTVFYSALWYTYLCRSKRVKSTYGPG